MILRTGIIALLFTLCLFGCSTTKPIVWKAQDISFTDFKAFEIRPVFNATGKSVKQDILSFLTASLKEEFELQNLQLADATQPTSRVLVVQSDILVYTTSKQVTGKQVATASGGAYWLAQCSLLTRLINKSTSNVVARISTTNEFGVKLREYENHERILKKSAATVATEVAKLMKPLEPEPSDSVWP
jgi:hypothetical protein